MNLSPFLLGICGLEFGIWIFLNVWFYPVLNIVQQFIDHYQHKQNRSIALEHRASSIFLGHNHPSEQPAPSEADLKITKKTQRFPRRMLSKVEAYLKYLFLINVAEQSRSIIVAHDVYYPFADEGAK